MRLTDFKAYNNFVNNVTFCYESLLSDIQKFVSLNKKLKNNLSLYLQDYPEELYSQMQEKVNEIISKYFSKENMRYEKTVWIDENKDKSIDIFSYDLIPLVQFVKPERVLGGESSSYSLSELYEFLFKFVNSKHLAEKAEELYTLQLIEASDKLKLAKSRHAKIEAKNTLSDLTSICSVMKEYLNDITTINQNSINKQTLAMQILPLLSDYNTFHNFISKNEKERKMEISKTQSEIKNNLELIAKLCGESTNKINQFLTSASLSLTNIISKARKQELVKLSVNAQDLIYLLSINEVGLLVKASVNEPENNNEIINLCNEFLLSKFDEINPLEKNIIK